MKANKLPNEYWEEEVACLVYNLSIYPTKSVKEKIHLEAWSGVNTCVSHLRVFGCVAYAHVLEELRKKVDVRSEIGIFVG